MILTYAVKGPTTYGVQLLRRAEAWAMRPQLQHRGIADAGDDRLQDIVHDLADVADMAGDLGFPKPGPHGLLTVRLDADAGKAPKKVLVVDAAILETLAGLIQEQEDLGYGVAEGLRRALDMLTGAAQP